MVTMIRTQECFPKDVMFGDLKLMDAPQPKHSACPKGHTIPGLIGGWMCPCECHQIKKQDPLDELKKYINDRLQEMWQEYFDKGLWRDPPEERFLDTNRSTLQRLIKKLNEDEVKINSEKIIGTIETIEETDGGVVVKFKPNEKGVKIINQIKLESDEFWSSISSIGKPRRY